MIMKNRKTKHRKSFILTLLFMCLFSLNLSWIPFVANRAIKGDSVLLVLCGAAFWLTAVLSLLMLTRTEKLRKELMKATPQSRKKDIPGVICFFQNPVAFCADVLLLFCTAAFLVAKLYERSNTVLFAGVSVIVLLLFVHAMLNGRSFRLLCSVKSRDRSESEKRNSR